MEILRKEIKEKMETRVALRFKNWCKNQKRFKLKIIYLIDASENWDINNFYVLLIRVSRSAHTHLKKADFLKDSKLNQN